MPHSKPETILYQDQLQLPKWKYWPTLLLVFFFNYGYVFAVLRCLVFTEPSGEYPDPMFTEVLFTKRFLEFSCMVLFTAALMIWYQRFMSSRWRIVMTDQTLYVRLARVSLRDARFVFTRKSGHPVKLEVVTKGFFGRKGIRLYGHCCDLALVEEKLRSTFSAAQFSEEP